MMNNNSTKHWLVVFLSLLLSSCCSLPERTQYRIAVQPNEKIVLDGMSMSRKEFYAYIKTKQPARSTIFIFSCVDGTRYIDALITQRILSTFGYWQFSIVCDEVAIPVVFAPIFDVYILSRPSQFLSFDVTKKDIVIDGKHIPFADFMSDPAILSALVGSPSSTDTAIEIICDIDAPCDILTKLLSIVYANGYEKIFIGAI